MCHSLLSRFFYLRCVLFRVYRILNLPSLGTYDLLLRTFSLKSTREFTGHVLPSLVMRRDQGRARLGSYTHFPTTCLSTKGVRLNDVCLEVSFLVPIPTRMGWICPLPNKSL